MFEALKSLFKSGPDANQKISEGALVIDVRSHAEWSSGHHPKARHVPLDEIGRRVKDIESWAGAKTKPIVVYCASGMRSGRARSILTQQGFSDVTNGGGLHALR